MSSAELHERLRKVVGKIYDEWIGSFVRITDPSYPSSALQKRYGKVVGLTFNGIGPSNGTPPHYYIIYNSIAKSADSLDETFLNLCLAANDNSVEAAAQHFQEAWYRHLHPEIVLFDHSKVSWACLNGVEHTTLENWLTECKREALKTYNQLCL